MLLDLDAHLSLLRATTIESHKNRL